MKVKKKLKYPYTITETPLGYSILIHTEEGGLSYPCLTQALCKVCNEPIVIQMEEDLVRLPHESCQKIVKSKLFRNLNDKEV